MLTLPLSSYLLLSAILFSIGMVGVLVRRNLIVLFMSIEIMLNASNLAFVAFARYSLDYGGQLFAFLVIAVAAAEAGIGLAIIVNVFRHRRSVDIDAMTLMRH